MEKIENTNTKIFISNNQVEKFYKNYDKEAIIEKNSIVLLNLILGSFNLPFFEEIETGFKLDLRYLNQENVEDLWLNFIRMDRSLGFFQFGIMDEQIKEQICDRAYLPTHLQDSFDYVNFHILLNALKEYLIPFIFSRFEDPIAQTFLEPKYIELVKNKKNQTYSLKIVMENWTDPIDKVDNSHFINLDDLEKITKKPKSRVNVLKKLRDVAQALDLLRAKGIQHYDVKPNNMVIRNNRERVSQKDNREQLDLDEALEVNEFTIILPDYGISSFIPSFGFKKYQFLGTPKYLAPEISGAINVIPRTKVADVFGFSLTIAKIILGDIPKFNVLNTTTQDFINSERPRIPSSFEHNYAYLFQTEEIESVSKRLSISYQKAWLIIQEIQQGLSIDPQKRTQSCTRVIDNIIAILHSN